MLAVLLDNLGAEVGEKVVLVEMGRECMDMQQHMLHCQARMICICQATYYKV
jgi:hypothetical protein